MRGKVTIGFFGSLGERIGRSVALDLPEQGSTVAELRSRLAELHPMASNELMRRGVLACASDEIVGEDHRVMPGSAVEFLPPLSGG